MPEFKYQIGDLVLTRVGIADSEAACRCGSPCMPHHFIVVERLAQECPGGVRLIYKLSNGGQVCSVLEIELADLEAFEWKLYQDAYSKYVANKTPA